MARIAGVNLPVNKRALVSLTYIHGIGPKFALDILKANDLDHTKRIKDFTDWQVDAEMMQEAKKDALFMHCLPAHRGEEVTADVIDGSQSVVWEEAENRLHVQKALLIELLK